MDTLTRRRFLGWTSAGAVGAGLVAIVPRLTSRAGTPPSASAPEMLGAQGATGPGARQPLALTEPVVAYVHNATGDVSLMVGTREVALHDPDLVARLIGGASGAR